MLRVEPKMLFYVVEWFQETAYGYSVLKQFRNMRIGYWFNLPVFGDSGDCLTSILDSQVPFDISFFYKLSISVLLRIRKDKTWYGCDTNSPDSQFHFGPWGQSFCTKRVKITAISPVSYNTYSAPSYSLYVAATKHLVETKSIDDGTFLSGTRETDLFVYKNSLFSNRFYLGDCMQAFQSI